MKLIFFTTPSHQILVDTVFLPSICEPWEIIGIELKSPGNGDFNSQPFLDTIYSKIIKVKELIEKYNGEVIVIADVDIQWFKPCQDRILSALDGFDIVFQKESGMPHREAAINAGVVAVRCSPRMVSLFSEIIPVIKEENINEQTYINRRIHQKDFPYSWGFLPNEFMNDDIERENNVSYKDIVLYHSTWTLPEANKSSIEIKLEKHKRMAELVKTG